MYTILSNRGSALSLILARLCCVWPNTLMTQVSGGVVVDAIFQSSGVVLERTPWCCRLGAPNPITGRGICNRGRGM